MPVVVIECLDFLGIVPQLLEIVRLLSFSPVLFTAAEAQSFPREYIACDLCMNVKV